LPDSKEQIVGIYRQNVHSNVRIKGFLYAAAAMLMISTNFVNNKLLLSGFNPATFGLVWAVFAAIHIIVIMLVQRQGKEIYRLQSDTLKRLALVGVIHGVGILFTWTSLDYLSPSLAALIWRFLPVLMLLLGVAFLGEQISTYEVFPIALMVIGAFVSVATAWDEFGIGVILAVIACFITAVQMVIVKQVVRDISPELLALYRNGVGAIVIALWGFSTQQINFHVSPSFWIIIFFGALVGESLTFIFFFRSYRYWELSRTGLVRTCEPLFVLLWSFLIFGALPKGQELIGGSIILIGAFWLALITINLPFTNYLVKD
jgi:drug/metabolite transporter (DMT)-like permease